MTEISRLHRELIARVLDHDAHASPSLRRAAFENADLDEPIRTLVGKVANRAYEVTDEDVASARAAGLSEDQVFEVVVCAAVGEASREYTGALAALAEATGAGQ